MQTHRRGEPTNRDDAGTGLPTSLARRRRAQRRRKTTITERGLAHEWFHGCEYINPDAIAQDELGDWNDAEIVLRAAKLATERRETCLNERRSLAFETVFSATDKPDFVVAGIFFADFFSWSLRGQVVFLSKAGAHLELSERFRRRARHRLLCRRASKELGTS